MYINSRIRANIFLSIFGLAAGSASVSAMSSVVLDERCRTGSCDQRMRCQTEQCNDNYMANNPHPGNPGNTYNNETALNACLAAVRAERNACDDISSGGGNPDILYALWVQFRMEMVACFNDFGPEGSNPSDTLLNSCIASTLDGYRHDLDQLLNPPTDGCSGEAVPLSYGGSFYAGPMGALQAAAIEAGQANGKYLTTVNTSLHINAGINITPGSAYDVSQIPCIKQALLMVVYNTKSGIVIENMDADTDTSDGTSFDVHLFGNDLKDTQTVSLVTIFYDDFDVPQLIEIGTLELQDSPITGDWNRDEVLNTQDVIDFLASYDAQTKRADINGDTQVTPADAMEFVNPTP